jgi:hypothetical protein
LGKQKIKVNALRGAGSHDAYFARERVCATQAINLTFVGGAHDGQQNAVTGGAVTG